MQARPGWAFSRYVSAMMAQRLPYRKRAMLRGPQVCEYAAIPSMAKGVFFIGAGLALREKDAAEVALANISGFGNWPGHASLAHKQDWDGAMELSGRDDARFEDIYDHLIGHIHAGALNLAGPPPDDYLLSPEQCAHLLQRWVEPGLLMGYLLPKTTRILMANWLATPADIQRLGAGRLSVIEKPLAASAEAACQGACESRRTKELLLLLTQSK